MTDAALSASATTETAVERRRTSRLMRSVAIVVSATDALGRAFRQETVTVDLNCSGCTYRSDRYVPKDMLVMLEIPSADLPWAARAARARVKWTRRPRTSRDDFRVALELEVPGNVWGVADPPADWFPHPDDVLTARVAEQEKAAAQAEAEQAAVSPAIPHRPAMLEAAESAVPERPCASAYEEIVMDFVAPSSAGSPKSIAQDSALASSEALNRIQAQIESTFRALIENAAASATLDLKQEALERAQSAIKLASKRGEATLAELEAAVRGALDKSVDTKKPRKSRKSRAKR